MTAFLSHIDLAPLFYGVIMFVGLWSMYYKFQRGLWAALTVEVVVFVLVFKLHGGSMNGGFAAMIAALLAGMFFRPKRK